jgi:predicted  nucleic acid-binding Zn-ribbon protein
MLDVQVQGLTHERSALEARLEATESKLAKAVEQRDAEAASVISLRERLAAAQAEGVSLHDRLRQAEALLLEAREAAASERAKLDEKLAAAVAAREDADKRREAALTELVTLQAQVVSLSSDRSSALAAQVSLVNESRR